LKIVGGAEAPSTPLGSATRDDMNIFCLSDLVKIDTLIEGTPIKYLITL